MAVGSIMLRKDLYSFLSLSNYLGNENPRMKLNCLPPAWVYWQCSPGVTRQMRFPLKHIPMWDSVVDREHSQWNSDFFYGLWKYNPSKNPKKIKRPLSESESEHKTNENLSIHFAWINRRNPNHQTIPIPNSKKQ